MILNDRDDLVDKVTITGTLGESDHIILEFLILKEAKAECSHTHRGKKWWSNCLMRMVN